MTLALGTPVTLTDRLVRVRIHRAGRSSLHASLIQEALAIANEPPMERDLRVISEWKLWVPYTWASPRLHNGLTYDDNAQPKDVQQGVIVQRVNLQQGGARWSYDEPSTWWQTGSLSAYRIAYDINRTPILATPHMLQETTR